MPNKIDIIKIKETMEKLTDKDFVIGLFNERLSGFYPGFDRMRDINFRIYKRHLGKSSMILVLEYVIEYYNQEGQLKKINIFASAHSDGSREKSFYAQNYLYANGFADGAYLVGRPLFYLAEQFAFFYEAAMGRTLRKIIKQAPEIDVPHVIRLSAQWVKKLHNCPIRNGHRFSNFDFSGTSPKPEKFQQDLGSVYPELGQRLAIIYKRLAVLQEKSAQNFKPTIIHGDYHPENIIFKSSLPDQVMVIDFTDLALGDPMLDLGSFIQQLDFMCFHIFSREQINKLKNIFLGYYFSKDFNQLNVDDLSRVNIYQAWVALRTTLLLFYAKSAKSSLAELISEIEQYLLLAEEKKHQVNLY